jgi:hypothetical protein
MGRLTTGRRPTRVGHHGGAAGTVPAVRGRRCPFTVSGRSTGGAATVSGTYARGLGVYDGTYQAP